MEVLVSKNAYNGYDLYREESNGTTYYSLGLPEKGESEVDMTVGWYSKDGFSFYFYMENIGPLTDGEEKAFAEGKKTFYQLVAETGDIDAALVRLLEIYEEDSSWWDRYYQKREAELEAAIIAAEDW